MNGAGTLSRIKRAEEEAEKRIKKAEKRAQGIVEAAKKRALEIEAESLKGAEQERKRILKNELKIVEKQRKAMASELERKLGMIRKTAKRNKGKAAKFLFSEFKRVVEGASTK